MLVQATKKNASGKMYQLKRSIPVEDDFDIIVAGGGPSGCAAAISAARLGAKVLLVEATGCLGGMGTSGLVTAWPSIGDDEKVIVGGIFYEIAMDLYEKGFLAPNNNPGMFHKSWIRFNLEGYKLILDKKVTEAGVDLRLFTQLIRCRFRC